MEKIRWLKILGVLIFSLGLGFSIWVFLNFRGVVQGLVKLAKDQVIVNEIQMLRREGGVRWESIRAIYLGNRKVSCEDKLKRQKCLVKLIFISLDSKGNPLIFGAYGGGWWDNKEYEVLLLPVVDEGEEMDTAMPRIASADLLERLERGDEVKLDIITKGIPEMVNSEPVLIKLLSDQENQIEALFDRFESSSEIKEGEFRSFIKSFLGFKDIILPVISYSKQL